MTSEMQEQQSRESNLEQQLDDLRQGYIKFGVEQSFCSHGGNAESFDEVWRLIGSAIELGEEHSIKIHGKSTGEFFRAFKSSPELREKFFDPELSSPNPNQQTSQAAPKSLAVPKVLYVSRQQLTSRAFMIEAGPAIMAGIRDNRIKVDDARAVQSGHEIREFLALKPETAPQTKAEKPVKRTTQVSKAQLLDRNFLRQVDREWEWSDQGGFLKAIQAGAIAVS